ncbi:MAG: hypothetical protein M0Z46_06775 [Actinomycetota bacterium]|nr:hypothetical protein [Actinomycetota bacterium]
MRESLWLAIPLWLLELHAPTGLGLFTFSLWELWTITRSRDRRSTAINRIRAAELIC